MTQENRKRGRWFRGLGIRDSFLAPAAACGFACGLASAVLFVGFHCPYRLALLKRWTWTPEERMPLVAGAIVAVAAVAAIHVARKRRRESMRLLPRAITFVAHAGIAVVLALGVVLTTRPFELPIDFFFSYGERLALEKKLAVYLPRDENGVGRPPDDGTPQIVVTLAPGRATVAGSAVEPKREPLRRAIEAETARLDATPSTVRVRFDVAPEVRFQTVIVAIDAMLMARTTDGWFSGVRPR